MIFIISYLICFIISIIILEYLEILKYYKIEKDNKKYRYINRLYLIKKLQELKEKQISCIWYDTIDNRRKINNILNLL